MSNLTLNPGAGNPVTKNPLCPKCEKQIIPVTYGENTTYECGCNYTQKFVFTSKSDMTENINYFQEEL